MGYLGFFSVRRMLHIFSPVPILMQVPNVPHPQNTSDSAMCVASHSSEECRPLFKTPFPSVPIASLTVPLETTSPPTPCV